MYAFSSSNLIDLEGQAQGGEAELPAKDLQLQQQEVSILPFSLRRLCRKEGKGEDSGEGDSSEKKKSMKAEEPAPAMDSLAGNKRSRSSSDDSSIDSSSDEDVSTNKRQRVK